ncbi:MAG TPA: hypothetical protein VF350_02455 [Candidatus Bathyarchaeia archaeon]
MAQAFADLGDEEKIKEFLAKRIEEPQVIPLKVFLIFCVVVGLETQINKGKQQYLKLLRLLASDSCWGIK